jgi:hypothetical protein
MPNNLNSTFISNWKDLTHAQVGLEFEFYSNHPYIKTLEMLNVAFNPIEIWGFNQYHSSFKVTEKKFKIEPDFSGGPNMIEMITGPMNWMDARVISIKMLDWINENGFTDDHCSVHVNVSFDDVKVHDLNLVKLILNFNEDFVYEKFPNRRNNIYARSIKWIVPFEGFDDSEVGLKHTLESLQIPDDTKYYGINLQKKWKGYLEYRYVGGTDYQKKTDTFLTLMDYFVMETRQAITEPLIAEDNIKLLSYLEDNINWFKKYTTYNEFLSNIDNIKVEMDKEGDYRTICANWDKFKGKIFEVVKNVEKFEGIRVNYNTETSRLEIVDGTLHKADLKYVDLINCKVTECTLFNCDLIDCEVDNGHIYNSNVYESKINNAKLSNCQALEDSLLENCMFDGGLIDCKMVEGVFRSGHMGENADIDITVKMNSKDSFWQVNPTDKIVKDLKK